MKSNGNDIEWRKRKKKLNFIWTIHYYDVSNSYHVYWNVEL